MAGLLSCYRVVHFELYVNMCITMTTTTTTLYLYVYLFYLSIHECSYYSSTVLYICCCCCVHVLCNLRRIQGLMERF